MIHDQRLWIELADTPAKRAQGLSDRLSLASDHGMLFIFPRAERYTFWMPRMHFDLDIIWLNGDEVVDIARLSAPKSGEEPVRYTSKHTANRVLEINAGQAKKYNIIIGDKLPELQIGKAFDEE